MRSSVRASTVGPSSRRGLDDDFHFVPRRTAFLSKYDTTANEYATRSDINKELIMSSAALEDNFDISNRSRQRDRDVMAAANRAITTGDSGSPDAHSVRSSNRDAGVVVGRRSTVRNTHKRSRSTPVKRPTYTTTEMVLPLDLKASAPPKPSPYLSQKYKSLRDKPPTTKNGQYAPMYSKTVRTSFSPLRESPFRDTSPYRSESPFLSRESPYRSPSPSPLETTTSLAKKRHKPRVLTSKRRVGNYYNRLLAKKSSNSKSGKYWPYLNVEDIEYENVSDLLSDTEVSPEGDAGGYSYRVKLGDSGAYDTYETASDDRYYEPGSYSYETDYDIPDEYVPFKPRQRLVSPERDYSQLSVLPYLPSRDPTKSSVADEISFNAVVAQSAARARRALENINWDAYDSAGLVLSVEGEYKPPEEEATPIGFRYISRPIMLKVPAAQRVSYRDSDNSFTRYMTDMRKFRDGIRLRLEEGYRTLNRDSKSVYTPPALPASESPISSYTPYVSKYRPSHTTYRRYLADDADNRYGHSLELYPTTSTRVPLSSIELYPTTSTRVPLSSLELYPTTSTRVPLSSFTSSSTTAASTRAMLDTDDTIPRSRSGAIKLYDSKADSDQKLGTLARVEIKVDTETHSSPRSAVAARRVMRGRSMPPAPVQNTNYEAALLANKVEAMLPPRKRQPRSGYAQAKMRQLRRDKRDSGEPEVAHVAIVEDTTTLRASPPVHVSTNVSKPMWDVDGIRKPNNIMSWKYRLDTYLSPDDLVIVPRTLSSVKARLRGCQDKLDRHRQLMDRYLVTDKGLTAEEQQELMRIKNSNANRKEPALLTEVTKPSDKVKKTRRKLQRKHQMEY